MITYTPTFAPLRPSPLHLSTSPSSPTSPLPTRSPLTELSPILSSVLANSAADSPNPHSPPPIPPLWTWSCHLCNMPYPLGATRRCLQDGHYFCSGITLDSNTGKRRKHKACGSVFDYIGWQSCGEWKREVRNRRSERTKQWLGSTALESKGCHGECEFPSECRWRPRLVEAAKARNTSISPITEEDEISPTSPSAMSSPPSPTSPPEPESNPGIVLQCAENWLKTGSEGGGRESENLATRQSVSVLDFAAFKAGMDRIHGAFSPGPTDYSAGRDIMDVDTHVDGPPQCLDAQLCYTSHPSSQAVCSGGGDVFPTMANEPPISPRRNAWDWSVGGLDGTPIGSMDGFMDIDG